MKSRLKEVIDLHNSLYLRLNHQETENDEVLAARNLFLSPSFRLPVSADQRRLLGFSLLKTAIGRCLRGAPNTLDVGTPTGFIISSSSCDYSNARHYITSMSGQQQLAYIIKDRLSFRGEFSWSDWFLWFRFALKHSFRIINAKQRSNLALSILEVLEIGVLLNLIHRNDIRKVYDFVPFEIDSNFLFLCTRNLGVHTTKIPSPGPLSTHNKIILSDELILSSGYHYDEMESLKSGVRVKQFSAWPPERAHTYYTLYAHQSQQTRPFEIGFYSHGEWIRMQMGSVQKNSSILQAEEDALRMLGKFLSEHPEFRLTIYPHPKERNGTTPEELQSYYARVTDNKHICIASADRGTTMRFQEVDIAITCYSTIIFERLYCGFKTLIKRIDKHEFPAPGSPIKTICFDDYPQFKALLEESASNTAADFFARHGLEKYLHHHFPTPISTLGEHLLLINYDFPPNQGIGGRRWGKLAKGLAHNGYVVHVIKAAPIQGNNESTWTADVQHPNIHVTTIPRTYPSVISHTGQSLVEKLRYRLALWRLKWMVKGTIYDLSAEWEPYLLRACERLCREFPIQRILATGAPWHMLYTVGEWNRSNARLPYLVDFRDPWLHAKNYGMADLDPRRKAFEAFKQERVLALADTVLSPYPAILEELQSFAQALKVQTGQFVALRHFYDADDFPTQANFNPVATSSAPFTIVYGGDLYQDMEPELESIVTFFRESPSMQTSVEMHIYTDARVPAFLKGIPGIHIYPSAGKSFYSKALEANALLIILPKHKNHEFTTKFYDYMPLKKPYIVASQGGIVADFVVENKMGYVWKSGNLYPWYEHLCNNTFNHQPAYDISTHSLSSATRQLITLFQ